MCSEKKYYIYVLKCKDNTLYTGYTDDVFRRLRVHNDGKGAKYTRGRRPVTLIYYEEFATKSEAMKQEAAFKRKKLPAKLAYIQANQDKCKIDIK